MCAALMLSGCQTRIQWDCGGEPPTISADAIGALPAKITVRDVIRIFTPGLPDPNTMMTLTYAKEGGGQYIFTWCPTHEVPGTPPPEPASERAALDWTILAIFDVSPSNEHQLNRWVYVYPKEQKGKLFTGWQGMPDWPEMK